MKDFSNSDKNCQQRTGVIYKITNLVNNMSYVGQTTQKLSARLKAHKRGKKSAISKAIQKYGWENFSYEVLEDNIPIDMLDEREIFWIGVYDCIAPKGYNKKPGGNGAGFKGRHHTEESLAKLSAASAGENNPMYGKHHTPETKKKISEANTGRKRPPISEETRAKKSAAQKGRPSPNKGKHLSEKTKKKLSIANQGKIVSEETRKKLSEISMGKKHTEESKRKMSESHKGQVAWNKGTPRTDEEKAKISETTRAAMTPEVRAKVSAANKGKTLPAEHRAKISATLRAYWAEKKKNSEEGCEE